MKRYLLLGFASAVLLLLTSCANTTAYYKTQVRNDLVKENWMQRINLSTATWTKNADRWFYAIEPEKFDDYARSAPSDRAITAMMVRVPDFTVIKIDGPYKVQIFGHQDHNSVVVLGSNESSRHTAIEIHGNTLSVHQASECKSCGNMKDVIVRIGVRTLTSLTVTGTGMIEGKDIGSNSLSIKSTDCAEILLSGFMNVCNISQSGAGSISVIGAYTPTLNVNVTGNGTVNVSGHVGVSRITKRGNGKINIIGADTDSLYIESSGGGITSIAGYANLKKLNATGNSQVYLYWVNSNGIYLNVHDNSRVGLAGSARNLNIEVDGTARFLGKYLRADNIYVTTRNKSHANVNPALKLFATAHDDSTIYFFSSPNVVSRYTTGNGFIIPVWCDSCTPMIQQPHLYPTTSLKGENLYKGMVPYNRN